MKKFEMDARKLNFLTVVRPIDDTDDDYTWKESDI